MLIQTHFIHLEQWMTSQRGRECPGSNAWVTVLNKIDLLHFTWIIFTSHYICFASILLTLFVVLRHPAATMTEGTLGFNFLSTYNLSISNLFRCCSYSSCLLRTSQEGCQKRRKRRRLGHILD